VKGAIVSRELHEDGTTEQKIFAPDYGEFYTGSDNEDEALAVTRLDFLMKKLRNAINDEEFDAANKGAKALRDHLAANFMGR